MIWLPLTSKMLASVAYDDQKQILHLRFRKTGDVYRYFEFPAATIRRFSTLNPEAASSSLKSETTSPTNASQTSTLLNQSRRPSPDAYPLPELTGLLLRWSAGRPSDQVLYFCSTRVCTRLPQIFPAVISGS